MSGLESFPVWLIWTLSVIVGLFLFSLAVFIHELGHFLVARWLGLRADVFSIGFGPALWKKKIGSTEVRVSAIPFGGYVSLPQLDPEGMQKIQGDHSDGEVIPPAAPWKRILVAVAGPAGNLVLALICACLIAWCSPPEATGASTTIGHVAEDSSAWEAGLQVDDRILAVNGNPVRSWDDFRTECYLSGGTNALITLTYERAGQMHETTARLDEKLSVKMEAYQISGLSPAPFRLGIAHVEKGSPAEAADLHVGDTILTVNGVPFKEATQLTQRADPIADVTLEIQPIDPRMPKRTVTLTPAMLPLDGETRALLGVGIGHLQQRTFQWMAERGVWAQIGADASGVVRVLKALTKPKSEGERGRAAKALGGPIMIFGLLIQMVQTGLWVSLGLLRLICVNLAILNLLPLPVLDGGHIVFALYAMIARREPNAKVVGYITNAFAFLLLGLMGLLVFVDISRFIP